MNGVGWVTESQIHFGMNKNHYKHGTCQRILEFGLGDKGSGGLH